MPSIRTAISIGQSIDRLFEFVTTVSNFPKWHPSSWTGPSEHLLRAGEHVTEELSLGGRHVRIQWIVRESSPPRRWVIGGKSEDGGTATITYTLLPESQGTRFKREFVYNIPVLFGELGDFLSLQRRLQAESAESLRCLKRILETEAIKDGSRHDLRWDATPDNPSSDRTSAIPATTAHVPSKTTNGMKSIRYEE